MLVVFIISVLFLNRTRIGRHIYAVGGNDTAARFSGIDTAKVKFMVYSFSGLMAGLAGITIASRLYSGTCTSGGRRRDGRYRRRGGGRYLHGRRLRQTGRHPHRCAHHRRAEQRPQPDGHQLDWQYIVKGAVILLAVYVDFLRNTKSKK